VIQLVVVLGTVEIIKDDSTRVIKKAQDVGVDVTFEEGLHLIHVYSMFFSYLPEARNTLNNIHKWISFIE
jgi:acetyl esterase/lipase